MDQPGLDEQSHVQALRGLQRINWLSRTAGVYWSKLRPLLQQNASQHANRPLTLLDVATGGGDTPIRLWQRARRAGYQLRIQGCDFSQQALEHARRQAGACDANIEFFACNVLQDPLPDTYDVVTCSLFLHHLDEADVVVLLANLARATRKVLMISDLNRTTWGLLMCYLGTRVLSRSPVVHVDGPLSVRAAFRPDEAMTLAHQAGLRSAHIRRIWPARWLLRWNP